MVINWMEADTNFGGGFYSPKKGAGEELVLAHWRLEEHTHEKDDKPNVKAIAFDVLKIGRLEYAQGEKVWRTKSYRFYEAIKPVLLAAEKRGESAVNVWVELTNDNMYKVLDMQVVRGIIDASPHPDREAARRAFLAETGGVSRG